MTIYLGGNYHLNFILCKPFWIWFGECHLCHTKFEHEKNDNEIWWHMKYNACWLLSFFSFSRWNCVSISQRFLFCVTVCHTQLMVFFFIFPLSCIIYPNAECCNIVKHNASWDKIKIMKCIFRKWWALFWSWLEPYRFM